MDGFDNWWDGQVAGFGQGVEDIGRSAIADVGNSYQQILTQDSGIGPPEHLTGDLVTTHDTVPVETATDRELENLIAAHEIGQEAEAEMIEHDIEPPQPEPTPSPDMGG